MSGWGLAGWCDALAALVFAGVGVWQGRRWRNAGARALAIACLAMALWLTAAATSAPAAGFAESVRNLAWLSFLYALLLRTGQDHRALSALYAVLGFVVAVTGIGDLLILIDPAPDGAALSLPLAITVLRMMFAVGSLVAVHNLYTATAAGSRGGVETPLAALAVLWTVDLTYDALAWQGDVALLDAARAAVALVLAPVIAIAARRNMGWALRLSRSFAFRSLGLVAALAYLALVVGAASLVTASGAPGARALVPLILIAAALLVAIGLTSPEWRAWLRVMAAKHLFAHRYDYRAEWLRFTETLGVPGPDGEPLDVRIVKAVADLVMAPGGMLLIPGASGLTSGQRWGWPTLATPLDAGSDILVDMLKGGRIVELDAVRDAAAHASYTTAFPEWLTADLAAWVIVPLVHFERLVGAVLLERPLVDRKLDWEDFDLLRLAGRQVASYLAEAQSQEALNDAARFDEFNRRFAFIMHDIKNLVSQLALVTRNAERHADKPEFRADMIATLQSSTARMNDLLARLSQHNSGRSEEARPVDLMTVAAAVAQRQRAQHPVVLIGAPTFALADQARLDQALAHLVQNAAEASPPNEPVTVKLVTLDDEAGIEVSDRGPGMTPEFVRASLFRPFASTKPNGFGVGAYEARTLVGAMGGRIGVVTAPGAGSSLTIWLPSAAPGHVRLAA